MKDMTSKLNAQPRKAALQDKCDILDIIESYNKTKWDKRIAKRYFDDYFRYPELFEKDAIFVIEEDGRIIGVIGYAIDIYETENYWLGWFYVHSAYCNKGHGKNLLEFVKKELKKLNVKKLFVDTSSDEFYKKALTFYIEFGFKLEAVIKNYYGKNEDQLILSLDL